MKTKKESAANRPGEYTGLELIQMSGEERRQAYATLRHGELIAELLLQATADMRAIAGWIEGAAGSLARGIKAIYSKPVKH